MSIRTTVSLDDDVVARLKEECTSLGIPFKKLLNQAVRAGLLAMKGPKQSKPYKVVPVNLGIRPGINYDDIGALLDLAEGETWR